MNRWKKTTWYSSVWLITNFNDSIYKMSINQHFTGDRFHRYANALSRGKVWESHRWQHCGSACGVCAQPPSRIARIGSLAAGFWMMFHVVKSIINHPQNHQKKWVGFKPSPVMVGLYRFMAARLSDESYNFQTRINEQRIARLRTSAWSKKDSLAGSPLKSRRGDVSFIYPISPSTSMGETMDKFATAGRKNVFGQAVKARTWEGECVIQMWQNMAGLKGNYIYIYIYYTHNHINIIWYDIYIYIIDIYTIHRWNTSLKYGFFKF